MIELFFRDSHLLRLACWLTLRRPSGRGVVLSVLPHSWRIMPNRLLDTIFKFTSTAPIMIKFWQSGLDFRYLSFSLWFSFLTKLRCEGRIRASIALIEPISPVMNKYAQALLIWFDSAVVSFSLLNTPLAFHLYHHSAVKELMQGRASRCFRGATTSCCSSDLPRISLSRNQASATPAGLRADLRSLSYLRCEVWQSRSPSRLPPVDLRIVTNIEVSEGSAYCSNILAHMSNNPTQGLSM